MNDAKLRLIVSGTDTGIGKTVLAALMTIVLDAWYWKPVQSGLDGESDSDAVRRLGGIPPERIIPEAYRLTLPLSPDQSARHDGVAIDPERLEFPDPPGALVVEGAGGLMVPLSEELLQIDLFARWGAPVILAARSGLGTLNHTLLSVEALRARAMPVAGIVLIGAEHRGNMASLERWCDAPIIGTIPQLGVLDRSTLAQAYQQRFRPVEEWI